MSAISRFVLVLILTIVSAHTLAAQTGVQFLEVGKPIERDLNGGEKHVFAFEGPGNSFINLAASQKGIDVAITVISPDGKKVIDFDSPFGPNVREVIWAVLDMAGKYTVEIRSVGAEAKPGKYEATLIEMAPATADLRHFAAAKNMIADGIIIGSGKSSDKLSRSSEKFLEASRISNLITEEIPRKAQLFAQLGGYFATNRMNEVSLNHYDRAVALFLEAGLKRDAANTLFSSARRAESQLDFIARTQRGRAIAVQLNDKLMEAKSFIDEGRGYYELGDFSKAVEMNSQALTLAIEIKNAREAGTAYNNLGAIFSAQANYAAALEAHQKAIEIEIAIDKKPKPESILNLGNVYHGLGNYALAIENFQRAFDEFEKMKANVGMAYALSNIGSAYLEMEQYEKALEYFLKAQPMKARFLPDDFSSYHNLAAVYQATGKQAEAVEYIEKAIELARKTGNNDGLARALIIKSDVLMDKGEYSVALETAIGAVGLAQKYDYLHHYWSALTTSAQAQLKLKRPDDARKSLIEAIASIERLRTQMVATDGNESFFEKRSDPYRMLMSLMVNEGKSAEALVMEERIKARTLLDSLSGGKVDVSKSMTPAEIKSETSLRYEMASLNLQASRATEKAKKDALLSQLEKKRLEFEDLRSRLYASHPELMAQRGDVSPLGVEEASSLIANPGVVLLEFAVDGDTTFAFIVSTSQARKPVISAVPLEVSRKDLSGKVEGFRAKLAAGDLDFQKASRELYDLLLKPAAAQLAGKTNIIIVPDGPLWDLPFQALMDDKGKFLVEKAAVSYAPSLTALREMSKKAKTRKPSPEAELLAFGNPIVGAPTKERVQRVFMSEKLEPIPEAERLVKELGKMYGPTRSKIFTGGDAREEIAKTESPKYRIVQFATHGILNNVSPMYSHLVLAQNEKNPNEDGLLEAWELKDLDLKADMVILSACDTARGKISNGEGVIGMTWASFIAGAPTTVASQWKVESSSTTELMLEFHRQLLGKQKISKAEALRRASLKLMKMPKYKHPSYWAGFVLVGDGS